MRGRAGVAAAVAVTAAAAALRVALTGPTAADAVQWGALLVPVALGVLLARRAPGSPVAAPLAWIGAAVGAVAALEAVAAADPGGAVAAVGAEGLWPLQLLPVVWLLLVFPAGPPAGRRWVAVPAAAGTAAVLVAAGQGAATGEPRGVPAAATLTGALLLLAALVGAVAVVVRRFRRGDERTRLQLRWLVAAAVSVPLALTTGWGVEILLGASVPVAYTAFVLTLLGLVPAAVTVAVVRHDLFDVDRLLGDTLAWALSSAVAAAVFAAVFLAAGEVADGRLGTAGGAFAAALCLLPVHRRMQYVVGRVVDRDRTVRLAGVRRFAELVRDGAAEPEAVEAVLRTALDDRAVRLLLRVPGADGYVDMSGAPADPGPAGPRLPLRTAEAEVGLLLLGHGSARRLRLAAEAARAARLPLEVSRLRLQLRRALAEVRDSRARLAAAGAEERRRLERDLHDGAQQQLVALGMRLRRLQSGAGDPVVAADLDAAVESLAGTVTELRRFARGLRPGRLDDGLAAALAHLVRDSALPVRLAVDDARLPDLVATTAYYVVAESVTNAAKHADATGVDVSVRVDGGTVRVRVADDGTGGVDGRGPTSLRDRVASAGGRLAVESPPGGGTTVEAVLPCGS